MLTFGRLIVAFVALFVHISLVLDVGLLVSVFVADGVLDPFDESSRSGNSSAMSPE